MDRSLSLQYGKTFFFFSVMKKHLHNPDPCPNLFFSEEDGFRYLHFGSPWIQGAMKVGRPYELVLEYPRQMMACGLFYPEPEQIVQLGLGAASLTKFCYKYTDAQIDVAEISKNVIMSAHQWFKCPMPDERLQIHLADARDFIAARQDFNPADWLQVDIYDEEAHGPVYDDVEFYRLCRRAMNKQGAVASFNLFGSRFDKSFSAISEAFEGRVLVMPEIDEGNRVVLGFAGAKLEITHDELYERAQELRHKWKLGAIKWVHGLKALNPALKEEVITL